MLVNDNTLYLNKSLEPVRVKTVKEKHGIEYIATRLDNTKYQIESNGMTMSIKNQIMDSASCISRPNNNMHS